MEPPTNGNPRSYLWMYPVILAFALSLLGWGIYRMARPGIHDPLVLAAGAVACIAVLLVWFHDINSRSAHERAFTHLDTLMDPVNERLQYLSVLVNQVSEQQLISERAKAIAFRESERDALRRTIREEISRKDYDSAMVLANEIETVFGYKQEADRFREDIRAQRDTDTRRAIGEGMAIIERCCRGEQWSAALREAERLMAAFPGDAEANKLPQEIENRRQAYKNQLLQSWHDAVNRHDVDGSIEILKKLDLYLTPTEAENLQETARQVFKDKLRLLGQQFSLAVKDHRWPESIRLGESIVREFPNSLMAQEVRDKMDLLRQRASEPEAARV